MTPTTLPTTLVQPFGLPSEPQHATAWLCDDWFAPGGVGEKFRRRHGMELERFRDTLDLSSLRHRVLVVGVGAIGRQVVLQLATMGIPTTIVDFDTVESRNLGAQGFPHTDVGKPKVTAVAGAVNSIYGARWNLCLPVVGKLEELSTSGSLSDNLNSVWSPYVISAVDKMDSRKYIAETSSRLASIYLEARMASLTLETWCVRDPASYRYWQQNWFPQSEANEAPCTNKTTIFCACLAASLLVSQLVRSIANLPNVPVRLSYDMRSESYESVFNPPTLY